MKLQMASPSFATLVARDIQSYKPFLSDVIILGISIQQANMDQQKYGKNYWESVLKIAALNDVAVFNYLKTCVL